MSTLDGYGLSIHEPGDVFSVACALYWHCADYHEGAGSERYRILSTLEYQPGASEHGPEPETTDRDVYDALASGAVTVSDAEAFVRAGLATKEW